jgi:hypothetical protein
MLLSRILTKAHKQNVCLSLWKKQTDHDTDYKYLPKQKVPGFMDRHLHNPTYRNGQAPCDCSSEVDYGVLQKFVMVVIALRQGFV